MQNCKNMKGACLCGAVKVSLTLQTDHFDACHCATCRKWGGGPLMAVDAGQSAEFEGAEFISVYDSSDWAQRAFCKRCGTHLFYRLKKTGTYALPVGLLDQTDHLKFNLQIFIEEKPSHYEFANVTEKITGAEAFERFAPNSV